MDLANALSRWSKLGYKTRDRHDVEGNYIIEFLNKDNQVVGWFKVYPGEGMQWEWPDELFITTVLID